MDSYLNDLRFKLFIILYILLINVPRVITIVNSSKKFKYFVFCVKMHYYNVGLYTILVLAASSNCKWFIFHNILCIIPNILGKCQISQYHWIHSNINRILHEETLCDQMSLKYNIQFYLKEIHYTTFLAIF